MSQIRTATRARPRRTGRSLKGEQAGGSPRHGESGHDGSSPLLACRVKVVLPPGPWVAEFTRAHPELKVVVESRLDLAQGRMLMEARVHAPDAGPWASEISSLPGVGQVEQVGPSGNVTRLRVVHTHSPFTPLFRGVQLMQRFPFPVQGGVATWVLVGPEARVRKFIEKLRTAAPGSIVESVRHDHAEGEGLLTPRQREILQRALAEGYFEVPRRATLTELAGKMGMAISSLSEALAIIERKLLVDQQRD